MYGIFLDSHSILGGVSIFLTKSRWILSVQNIFVLFGLHFPVLLTNLPIQGTAKNDKFHCDATTTVESFHLPITKQEEENSYSSLTMLLFLDLGVEIRDPSSTTNSSTNFEEVTSFF